MQLALSHTIGFGTIKDDREAILILHKHSLGHVELQSQIQLINDNIQESLNKDHLSPVLQHRRFLQFLDFPQYYREKRLLGKAEIIYKRDIQNIQLVFGQSHILCLNLRARLAMIIKSQGQSKKAGKIEVQIIEMSSRVLGAEHPFTLTNISNLASIYWDQGRWKEAEELEVQTMDARKRVLGEEHPDTLSSIANLASTYSNQGRWQEAEKLQVQVMEVRKRVLGEEHPDTLSSIANLASTYSNQGRWQEAEKLQVQVMEVRKRVLSSSIE